MTARRTARFHPLYQARLHLLDGFPGPGILNDPAADAARTAFGEPFGDPGLPEVDTQDREVPGPNGPVPVRIYRRRQRSPDPVVGLVWFHGGAFMWGDLDIPEADHFARQMAHRTGAVVISVDYRLCNDKVHLPVPHDDSYAVYTWVRQHAADLGIDPARLAVGGGSAGGTLAASVSLHASDTGQRPWQMLLAYPVLHPDLPEAGDELRAAIEATPPALQFTPQACVQINEYVLGRPNSTATAYDFPGLAPDHSRFPPAYIENSEFDTLRASGERFAEDLAAAGVPVEQVTAEGVPHGHLGAVGSPMLEAAYQRFARRLLTGRATDRSHH